MPKLILVMDDASSSLATLAGDLSDAGYTTVSLQASDDVVSYYDENEADLVFINLQAEMALGVCEGIRDLLSGAIVPIIFVGSGHEEVTSPAQALALGGDFYFGQPIDFEQVLAKVQTYVGQATDHDDIDDDLPDYEFEAPADDPAADRLESAADDLLAQIEAESEDASGEAPLDEDVFGEPEPSDPPAPAVELVGDQATVESPEVDFLEDDGPFSAAGLAEGGPEPDAAEDEALDGDATFEDDGAYGDVGLDPEPEMPRDDVVEGLAPEVSAPIVVDTAEDGEPAPVAEHDDLDTPSEMAAVAATDAIDDVIDVGHEDGVGSDAALVDQPADLDSASMADGNALDAVHPGMADEEAEVEAEVSVAIPAEPAADGAPAERIADAHDEVYVEAVGGAVDGGDEFAGDVTGMDDSAGLEDSIDDSVEVPEHVDDAQSRLDSGGAGTTDVDAFLTSVGLGDEVLAAEAFAAAEDEGPTTEPAVTEPAAPATRVEVAEVDEVEADVADVEGADDLPDLDEPSSPLELIPDEPDPEDPGATEVAFEPEAEGVDAAKAGVAAIDADLHAEAEPAAEDDFEAAAGEFDKVEEEVSQAIATPASAESVAAIEERLADELRQRMQALEAEARERQEEQLRLAQEQLLLEQQRQQEVARERLERDLRGKLQAEYERQIAAERESLAAERAALEEERERLREQQSQAAATPPELPSRRVEAERRSEMRALTREGRVRRRPRPRLPVTVRTTPDVVRMSEEARQRAEHEVHVRSQMASQQHRRQQDAERRARVERERTIAAHARREQGLADARDEAALRRQIESEIRAEMGLPPVADPALGASDVAFNPPEKPTGQFGNDPDVARCLNSFWQQRVTGRVLFSTDRHETSVYLVRGAPVAAESDNTYYRIEEYLYRTGRITRAQYHQARVKDLHTPRRMGAYLVSEGFMKPHELFSSVRGFLEEVFFGLFEFEGGAYMFTPEMVDEDQQVTLEREPPALIVDGIRRKYLLPRLMEAVGGPASLLRPAEGAEIDPGSLGLAPEEHRVVRLMDGTRSVEDLVFSTGLPAERVYVVLVALVSMGMADVLVRGVGGDEEPGDSPTDVIDVERIHEKLRQVRNEDYFEVLGIGREATTYEVERAYERVARDFASARFSSPVIEGNRAALAEIDRVLQDARQVLGDLEVRDAYAAHLPEAPTQA